MYIERETLFILCMAQVILQWLNYLFCLKLSHLKIIYSCIFSCWFVIPQSQASSKNEADDSDGDSDNSHSNHDITTTDDGDMNIHDDDHGMASQFFSESDFSSDNDDDDVCNKNQLIQGPNTMMEREQPKTNNSSGKKATAKSRNEGGIMGRKPTIHRRQNQELVTSESSFEEDVVGVHDQTKGQEKAILHRDGRVEHRVKGRPYNNTIKHGVRGQMENVKRSKEGVVPTKPDRNQSKSDKNSVQGKKQSAKQRKEKAVNDIFSKYFAVNVCGYVYL